VGTAAKELGAFQSGDAGEVEALASQLSEATSSQLAESASSSVQYLEGESSQL
jgi:hypothetical protein